MRSKQQQPNQNPAPVFRSITPRAERDPAPTDSGVIGQAAISAAALQQLNRYADDIQAFLHESQLDAILDRLQADLDLADPDLNPFPSYRRE